MIFRFLRRKKITAMDFKHFGLPSLAIFSVPTSKEFSILSSKSWTYTAAKKGEKEKPLGEALETKSSLKFPA